jgi:hypothetical protein
MIAYWWASCACRKEWRVTLIPSNPVEKKKSYGMFPVGVHILYLGAQANRQRRIA